MSLLRNAIKSHVAVRTIKPIHALPSFLRESPRCFSTESNQPQAPQPDASVNQFLQSASRGSIYLFIFPQGKIIGLAKNTKKSDVMNLLEGCNLTADDIEVCYNRVFLPVGMMLRFSSPYAFNYAVRLLRKFDRIYKLDRVEASDWDSVSPYNGKTVVLQGIPRNATVEDVERFLSGCDYDSSSIELGTNPRPGNTFPGKLATVQFPSKVQAMNAFITKNRTVFVNSRITVRVLH